MSDFLALRDSRRDSLLKEYAEQEFEDDGTMLEVNIDIGDEDECCEMIKQNYGKHINFSYPRKWFLKPKHGETVQRGVHWEYANPAEQGKIPLSEHDKWGIDCNRIRRALESNAFNERGRDREAVSRRKDIYNKILKEWDECEKNKNSWKNELR